MRWATGWTRASGTDRLRAFRSHSDQPPYVDGDVNVVS